MKQFSDVIRILLRSAGMFAFLFLLLVTHASAQDGGAAPVPTGPPADMRLTTMLDQLLVTHDRIQAAEAVVSSTEHQADRAKAAWLPRVDVFADVNHEAIDQTITEDGTDTSKFRNEQSLTATQLIYDFGGTGGNIDVQKALHSEAQARLEQTRQLVLVQGITSYLMVVRGREMLKYALQSEDNIKTLSGMQEALVERGAGLSYEELQVKGQLAGAQAHRVSQERALQNALNSFRAVYGYTLTEAEIVRLDMPPLPMDEVPATLEDAIAQAEDANPLLLELRHAVSRSQGQLRAAESTYYPTFEFVSELKRKEQDQGAQGVRYEEKTGIQMNYNLFNGGGDTAAVGAAKSDIVAARKTALDQRRSVEEAVRNAWIDLITLRKNVELFENQADINWEFLALVKKKKAMGAEVGLLDILVGERDYINAISARVASEIDSIIAAYTLLFQMGDISMDTVAAR